ncbi:hypothetical protein ACGFNP_30335 [Nonomuraea sp. NPDC049269]|uniref:hypothetical protein n=1 Tax=Nonomuraea sp. NPDC049269 TaxID=3364349 RepID=UPI00371833CA
MIEVRTPDPFGAWPLAECDAFSGLALSALVSPAEVGTVMATLADVHVPDCEELDADTIVRRLLEQDALIAPGGLELHDPSTGVTIVPGCCSGLEDWRAWSEAPAGGDVWLGHDPAPSIAVNGDRLRVRQDGGPGEGGDFVDVPVALFPALLETVHHDLVGFLGRVEEWADGVTSSLSAALVRRLDEALSISEPSGDVAGVYGLRPTPP